jgi:acyl-CoA reductase-like NAD-dependent aldehyde dehydrogenase
VTLDVLRVDLRAEDGTVGAWLVAHPGIDKARSTGSTRTGIAVGKSAMENVTRVSLELS